MSKLQFLDAWKEGMSSFFASKSAQGVLGANVAMAASGACGASCGTGGAEKNEEEPKPSACGASCGASDDGEKKEEAESSACGASCGASDGK